LRIAGDVDDAQWSPRGDAIAYSRDADVYVATLGRRTIARRVTRGGVPGDLLNGTLDWVYPEELGIEHGFRWSPDGRRIAYMTMDERRVTNFPIVDFLTSTTRSPTIGIRWPVKPIRASRCGSWILRRVPIA
jgi:dipeptidyl-peptidase-4